MLTAVLQAENIFPLLGLARFLLITGIALSNLLFCCMQGDLPCCCGHGSACFTQGAHLEADRKQHRSVAAVCIADADRRDLKANYFAPGDIFAGRRICFYSTTPGDLAVVPALQELGDCCRRLLSSRGVDVQVSVCMGFWYEPLDDRVARVVNCLAPHLCGLSAHPRHQQGFRRQHLLPAAAQLEQVTGIADARCLSWLGHFHLLKVLHIDVQRQHPAFLLPPLPRLHTLSLRFSGTLLREVNWQCLFSCAPALRQLVLDCAEHPCHEGSHDGLDRWDIEALVGLQCQQLDLLTLETDAVDEHTVQLLAGIQCPVKLSINTYDWRRLNSAPLNVLLALLPNLVALTFISLDTKLLDALWDQHGPCLPDVQCLEIWRLCLAKPDSHLPLQRILSRCPALKHLSLHADDPPLSRAQRSEVYARLSHAFQNAKLVSLVCE